MYCENPAVERAATVMVISLREKEISSRIKVVGKLPKYLRERLGGN